jgi:hypothetical protein
MKITLGTHEQTHTGEKPHKCSDWKILHASYNIRDFTQERLPLHILNVEYSVYAKMISSPIRELTQERNHMNAMNVGKPLLQNQGSVSIKENTQETGLMGVTITGKLLPICQSLLNTRAFTGSHFGKASC